MRQTILAMFVIGSLMPRNSANQSHQCSVCYKTSQRENQLCLAMLISSMIQTKIMSSLPRLFSSCSKLRNTAATIKLDRLLFHSSQEVTSTQCPYHLFFLHSITKIFSMFLYSENRKVHQFGEFLPIWSRVKY